MTFSTGKLRLQSYIGSAAFNLLSQADFCRSWDELHQACPWATAFQSRAFAQNWYAVYAPIYEPWIVCGHDGRGRLAGLFLLALRRSPRELVHAGAHQAEYHVWIATPDHADNFAEQALDHLAEMLPSASLRLLFLPGGAPLAWVDAGRRWARRSSLRYFKRPLMRVGEGSQVEKSLRKKSNKSRLNRLEHIAPLRLEVLRTRREMELCFDQIIDYCDLRQGAVNGNLPFRQDPLKKEFYLRLMEAPGLMHTSVLRLGNDMIAAHIGARDRTTVHLGLIAHSPFYANHSPGKLLLLLLGRQLGQEGFRDLDLTPGGAYKDRFADHSDEVFVLDIFFRMRDVWRFRWRQRLARGAKSVLTVAGITPDNARKRIDAVRRTLNKATEI